MSVRLALRLIETQAANLGPDDMAAYDLLPPDVRAAVAGTMFPYSARAVRALLARGHGLAELARALAVADEAFCAGELPADDATTSEGGTGT